MPGQIPNPISLREACHLVAEQNKSIGYPPNRFEPAVSGVSNEGLVKVCNRLLLSTEAFFALDKALGRFPGLLTLEDLVALSTYGEYWSLEDAAMLSAKDRVEHFDRLVGAKRWSNE